ncbi:MAG: acyl-CoA reductase [Candidatus Sulfotelmatobacter sp.]
MNEIVHLVDSPEIIICAAQRLRRLAQESEVTPETILQVFDRWAGALADRELSNIPGATFLRLWLRRGNLEPILLRELGSNSLSDRWHEDGSARLRSFPLGVIGHWPAANVEIQPVLSLTCALLGGNSCLVRVPISLVDITRRLMEKLQEVDPSGTVTERVFLASFDHSRKELQEAMAQSVDGAMIWGGAEAVSEIRALPFCHWARILIFGPRLSAAAMDAGTWGNRDLRRSWCQRIARDVWQFDQQACSSPQTLFLERSADCEPADFAEDLRRAFEEENRQHPRLEIEPALASAICNARASWLLADERNRAWFPPSPDWTVLLGSDTKMPEPTQGRTLTILVADDLIDVVSQFDGTLQTLGLGISDPEREAMLAEAAGRRGVDRIVKLGRMHAFSSPWDGTELIRSMVRIVRHVPSAD